jgi:suppressor of G2 allele of SKP1
MARALEGARQLSVSVRLPHGSEYSLDLDLALPVVPEACAYEVLSTKIEIKLKKAEVGIKWPGLERSTVPPGPLPAAAAVPAPAASSAGAGGAPRPTYPSSSKRTHNWDALEKEVKREEDAETPEGDAALQKVHLSLRTMCVAHDAADRGRPPPQLFRQIYANGTEEQRRAMNKSFVRRRQDRVVHTDRMTDQPRGLGAQSQSGGTTLSTNWEDVCRARVCDCARLALTDAWPQIAAREVVPTPPEGMEARKWDAV